MLTDEQCDEFRASRGTFNDMVREIHEAGRKRERCAMTLTDYQLEIAARKLCELLCWAVTEFNMKTARETLALHLKRPAVQAIAYALAQKEES